MHVHLCVGKAPEDMDGTILLESSSSQTLCDYTVWHSYEHPKMVRLGAQNKDKLGPLWAFDPFQQKVAMHLGLPIEQVGKDRKSLQVAMNALPPHQWAALLFDNLYYDVYIMASHYGGCDLYMRSPMDRPVYRWYHYSARTIDGDPVMWW